MTRRVITTGMRNPHLRGYDGRDCRSDEQWIRRPRPRSFVAYVIWQGWSEISLGVHVSLIDPNIEIHLPFLFARIGWQR